MEWCPNPTRWSNLRGMRRPSAFRREYRRGEDQGWIAGVICLVNQFVLGLTPITSALSTNNTLYHTSFKRHAGGEASRVSKYGQNYNTTYIPTVTPTAFYKDPWTSTKDRISISISYILAYTRSNNVD